MFRLVMGNDIDITSDFQHQYQNNFFLIPIVV